MAIGSKFLTFVLLTLFLVSCAGKGKIVTNMSLVDPSERIPPSRVVEAFSKPPERPYREIAQLETLATEEVLSGIQMVEHMRAKATTIGADAIIVDQNQEGRKIVNNPMGINEKEVFRVLKGVAIKFR
ncbi:MAG: hypothetical protein HQL64_03780 [Magnetococcales bacterium]|nr:hypothetical protein [Magnetococcales bacterium]